MNGMRAIVNFEKILFDFEAFRPTRDIGALRLKSGENLGKICGKS
jgi:hypothetical protein